MRRSALRRGWKIGVLLAGASPLGGCGLLSAWVVGDIPYAHDADESLAVCRHVIDSGVVPESAAVGRGPTGRRRELDVTGVEDREVQDAILVVAAEARRLYSTKPVEVQFYAGRVEHLPQGGARYPEPRRLIRTETIE